MFLTVFPTYVYCCDTALTSNALWFPTLTPPPAPSPHPSHTHTSQAWKSLRPQFVRTIGTLISLTSLKEIKCEVYLTQRRLSKHQFPPLSQFIKMLAILTLYRQKVMLI